MALSCKNGVCIAGKRLSRKKLNALIPKHDKFIEAFAGNAWVYRECLKTGNCSDNAVLNDINCKTTSHLKKEFGSRYQCGHDYKKIIEKHDGKNSFFFLDPPYPNACKSGYYGKYCDLDHDELLKVIKKIKGKFMLTTSTDQRPKFCKDFKCKIITTSGMYGRKLKDLVIKNY